MMCFGLEYTGNAISSTVARLAYFGMTVARFRVARIRTKLRRGILMSLCTCILYAHVAAKVCSEL